MQQYKHFTFNDREIIKKNLAEGKSLRFIAKQVGKNVSSVSREVRRNASNYETNDNSEVMISDAITLGSF